MTQCNYVPFQLSLDEPHHPYLDELFDLDILCTEEGIFINPPERE